MKNRLIKELKDVSLSMFRKNFLGIFHGSISAKLEEDSFIINKKESIFDDMQDSDFIELHSKKDGRWSEASLDSDIHANIYKYVSSAKYIAYAMPPFTTSYALDFSTIYPKDYFGKEKFDKIEVYDPKNFDTWYERSPNEIYQHFKKADIDMMVIKGYGVYAYNRNLISLVKNIAILENSCKILHYSLHNKIGRKNHSLTKL